jgi:1-aminocyclopropane-1-carboxylate deaminase/D-cysteine desulfhydrase-like pyridoxal-dependent ACC family enzyme
MKLLTSNTPIEKHRCGKRDVHVKREDLCCDGPSFSKLRGVAAHIQVRSEGTIGVLDTFHSRAGWGVAHLCRALSRRAVVFYPVYKGDLLIRGNQLKARELGADIRGLTAGRSCILYHRAKKDLAEQYHDGYMLPNALKCPETIEETAKEVMTVPERFMKDTLWVVSISSGTIAAGVYLGLVQRKARVGLLLHEGYSRPEKSVIDYVTKYTPDQGHVMMSVVDEGYEYKQAAAGVAPFPCNRYYDLKAWRWLERNGSLSNYSKIMFWNIGA